jgi:hypothetical protein
VYSLILANKIIIYISFIGILNQNTEPLPNSDVNPISPFISATNFLHIDKPNPVPVSLCVYFVNTSACWFSLIPEPVSITEIFI